MSLRATLWAYDEAPVDKALDLLVLIALADEANDLGRNAFPSVAKIAARARCKPRAAKYALRALEDAGIIMRGDQSIAARHIARADRRPVVYDLNMDLTSESPRPQPPQGAPDAPREGERGASAGTDGVHGNDARGARSGTNGVHTRAPDPTNDPTTDPTDDPSGASRRTPRRPETTIPEDFEVTAAMKAWFEQQEWAKHVTHPGIETQNFIDHHVAKGSLYRDWPRAWQTWMRNAGTKYAASGPASNVRPMANRHVTPDSASHADRVAWFSGQQGAQS